MRKLKKEFKKIVKFPESELDTFRGGMATYSFMLKKRLDQVSVNMIEEGLLSETEIGIFHAIIDDSIRNVNSYSYKELNKLFNTFVKASLIHAIPDEVLEP